MEHEFSLKYYQALLSLTHSLSFVRLCVGHLCAKFVCIDVRDFNFKGKIGIMLGEFSCCLFVKLWIQVIVNTSLLNTMKRERLKYTLYVSPSCSFTLITLVWISSLFWNLPWVYGLDIDRWKKKYVNQTFSGILNFCKHYFPGYVQWGGGFHTSLMLMDPLFCVFIDVTLQALLHFLSCVRSKLRGRGQFWNFTS